MSEYVGYDCMICDSAFPYNIQHCAKVSEHVDFLTGKETRKTKAEFWANQFH